MEAYGQEFYFDLMRVFADLMVLIYDGYALKFDIPIWGAYGGLLKAWQLGAARLCLNSCLELLSIMHWQERSRACSDESGRRKSAMSVGKEIE
ncbi:hypothetical protein GOBAR_DD35956 [Gossypium barbadense]|nr:hypothetical protein GOBAR_DD35956 [Gossypium barbadense]